MAESNTLVKRNDYDIENKLLLKEKEIYEKIVAERKNEMSTLNNKTEYDKLYDKLHEYDKILFYK